MASQKPSWHYSLGLSLILLLLGLICRLRWLVITATLFLWLFSLGLVSQTLWRWLEAPWERQLVDLVPSADAIVVLSGGRHPAPGKERISEWHDPDRFFAGLGSSWLARHLDCYLPVVPVRSGLASHLKAICFYRKPNSWESQVRPWRARIP